jgi:Subtilase family
MPFPPELVDLVQAQIDRLNFLVGPDAPREDLDGVLRENISAVLTGDPPDRDAVDVQPVYAHTLDQSASEGLLAVVDSVLVWERDTRAAIDALSNAGIAVARDPVKVTPRVVQLTLEARRDDDGRLLTDAVQVIDRAGLRVSFEHCPVANVAVKGDPAPIAAPDRTLPERPPPDPRPCGCKRPTVAVVDVGVDDLEARLGRGDRWLADVAGDEEPTARGHDQAMRLVNGAGHGTSVAGVIQRAAPDVNVVSYKALYRGLGSEVNVARKILEAAMKGADIINLSLSTSVLERYVPLAIEDALFHVPDDVLIVASAGNDGAWSAFPGEFKRVIAVGATDLDGNPVAYSNRGHWVDFSTTGTVLAPFIHGTLNDLVDPTGRRLGVFGGPNPTAVATGTSFAAPQVSAMLAQLLAEGYEPADAVARLKTRGRPEPDFGYVLYGLDQ